MRTQDIMECEFSGEMTAHVNASYLSALVSAHDGGTVQLRIFNNGRLLTLRPQDAYDTLIVLMGRSDLSVRHHEPV